MEEGQVQEPSTGQGDTDKAPLEGVRQLLVYSHQRHLLDSGCTAMETNITQDVGVGDGHLPVPTIDARGVLALYEIRNIFSPLMMT